MQMPGSIAAANLPCDDRPSDAAFGHVVFGRNATMLRPLKDPPGMPTEDVLTLLESRILGLSVDRLTTAASDSTTRKAFMRGLCQEGGPARPVILSINAI